MVLSESYRKAKEVNNRAADSEMLYRVHSFLDYLMPIVLMFLFYVLYLDFFVDLNHSQHQFLLTAERAILIYFIFEIFVDFLIYENNREFLKNKWFDILLVLPFLSILRGFRGLKVLKLGKSAKTSKIAKGMKFAKHGKKAQHSTKFIKKSSEKLREFLND